MGPYHKRTHREVIRVPRPDELTINVQIEERKRKYIGTQLEDVKQSEDELILAESIQVAEFTGEIERPREQPQKRCLWCNSRRVTLIMLLCGFIVIILFLIIIIGHFYTPHKTQSKDFVKHAHDKKYKL